MGTLWNEIFSSQCYVIQHKIWQLNMFISNNIMRLNRLYCFPSNIIVNHHSNDMGSNPKTIFILFLIFIALLNRTYICIRNHMSIDIVSSSIQWFYCRWKFSITKHYTFGWFFSVLNISRLKNRIRDIKGRTLLP